MSFGKQSGTTYSNPELTPEQRQQIQAQNELFTSTIAPNIKGAVTGATNLYQSNAPGVLNAAQNLAGTASQAGQTLGETGESAVRTGITGLESLFGKDYERQQLEAALGPAQGMYQKNLQDLSAQFGSAGGLGSARNALAAGRSQRLTLQTRIHSAEAVGHHAHDLQRELRRLLHPGQTCQLWRHSAGPLGSYTRRPEPYALVDPLIACFCP